MKRRLRKRDRARRLAEQVLRHRLDAVHARAQIDAIQIELENLPLGELRLDEERDAAFLDLAAERLDVREEERARELLRQRAAAFHSPSAAQIANDRAPHADRIDSGMEVEAPILDGDDRVLQIGRDLGRATRRAAARRGGTTAGRRRRRRRCRRSRASGGAPRRRSATATRRTTAAPPMSADISASASQPVQPRGRIVISGDLRRRPRLQPCVQPAPSRAHRPAPDRRSRR